MAAQRAETQDAHAALRGDRRIQLIPRARDLLGAVVQILAMEA